MPGHPSSNPKPSRFSNVHMLATSFAAIAGVAITAWQVLLPAAAPLAPPVQVTVVQPPVEAAAVAKGDAVNLDAVDLGQGATFSAALNDGSEQRYHFADMFDGNASTSISIASPDQELDVLVSFAETSAQSVSAIEYVPPPQNVSGQAATKLDVAVLPEGQMDASGLAIQSFTLQTTPGKQSFVIPDKAMGKALWIRVAGPDGATNIAVGDFRILKQ
jgi:hypothetical protein